MIASHRDGEITFYEELGVARDASHEQIRDAFRLFVRLLHPDQQTDPQLKEFAENQMRKLNRIYHVLSDPESRRRYDETLDEDYDPPAVFDPPSPAPRQLGARAAWAAAIVLSAGLLIWLASANSPTGQGLTTDANVVTVSNPAPAAPGSSAGTSSDRTALASRIFRLQSDLRAVIVERDAAIGELNRLRRTSQDPKTAGSTSASATDPGPALTITELPSAPKTAELPGAGLSRPERPAKRQFAGFWFYAMPPLGQTNKNKTLYPPEYIEATIMETGGTIRGSFRSRFEISDRAISPDVNFTFTGAANGSQVSCPWTGAGGAKGDVTLKLTSENSMRVDWIANELGTQQGLASGTAVLTRRIE